MESNAFGRVMVKSDETIKFNHGAACLAGFVKAAGGLAPVDCPGVQNVNLSNLVNGHFDYVQKIDEIMEIIAVNIV